MWESLLRGADAQAALDIVREIAETPLVAPAMDRAVFWAYASNLLVEPSAEAAYDQAVGDLIDDLHRGVAHLGLYDGLAGIGWTLCHVLEADSAESLAVIDDAFLNVLAVEDWHGPLDLVEGLVGFGVYFLERVAVGRSVAAHEGLARVVHHLDTLATQVETGTTWFTPAAVLPAATAARFPNGYFDCGLAHGVPGMVAFLGRVCALGSAPARARPLLDDAVRWVMAQRLPGATGFPSKIVGAGIEGRLRNAWCYGDAGIAAALCGPAAILDDPALRLLAMDVATASAERPAEQCGVIDAALCHGAAGLAHLFNRLWQATRAPHLEAAARAWFARTLAMRGELGVAGFSAVKHGASGDIEHRPDAGFLDGAIGIGLALLAAATPIEPNWDRLLLCDVPPSRSPTR